MPTRNPFPTATPRLVLLLTAAAACADASGGREPRESFSPPAQALVPRTLFASDSLGSPRALTVLGDRLVVGDDRGASPLWILYRSDPRRRVAFGRRGRGPEEFRSIWSITAEPNGKGIWVYDLGLRRMSRVDLGTGSPRVTTTFVMQVEQTLTGPALLSNSTFLTPGFLPNGRVAVLDAEGRLLRTLGEVPPGEPEVPSHVRQHAYQSTLRVKPDRSRFVIATRHADQVEIYDADGALIRKVKGPDDFTPVYRVLRRGGQDAMETGADLRFGYVSLAVTDDWIFGLYSGHTRRERPGRANYGDVLHVYDWEGVLRHALRLRDPSISIAVDPEGRTLYAAREDPEPAILEYALPLPSQGEARD